MSTTLLQTRPMSANQPRRIGDFVLGALLGKGGTAEVYAARHRTSGQQVAVKVLRAEYTAERDVVTAFVDEATRTRAIQHPNVVRIIDAGRDEASGCCYLAMEHIAGESLAERLRREGPLPEATVRSIAASLADGMQAAHAAGIVHRDLKPGNVMLRRTPTGSDDVVIVDFGIAKSLGHQSAVRTTRRVGTVAYMAPEQIAEGLITPAVDIWALGVIMFEALTGALPFANFEDGRCPQLVETPPRVTSLVSVTSAISFVVARCLDRSAGNRPASMADLAMSLRSDVDERLTEDVPLSVQVPMPSAEPAPVAVALPASTQQRRWPFIAGAGVLAGGVLAVAFAVRSPRAPSALEAATPSATAATTPPAPPEQNEQPPVATSEPAVTAERVPEPTVATTQRPATTKPKPKPKRTRKFARHSTTSPTTTKPPATSQGETLD